jgi:hypothetical protein
VKKLLRKKKLYFFIFILSIIIISILLSYFFLRSSLLQNENENFLILTNEKKYFVDNNINFRINNYNNIDNITWKINGNFQTNSYNFKYSFDHSNVYNISADIKVNEASYHTYKIIEVLNDDDYSTFSGSGIRDMGPGGHGVGEFINVLPSITIPTIDINLKINDIFGLFRITVTSLDRQTDQTEVLFDEQISAINQDYLYNKNYTFNEITPDSNVLEVIVIIEVIEGRCGHWIVELWSYY